MSTSITMDGGGYKDEELRLIEELVEGQIYQRPVGGPRPIAAVRPAVSFHGTVEEARARLRTPGDHIFLPAGARAIVAEPLDDLKIRFEVWASEARDRRFTGKLDPGDALVTGYGGDVGLALYEFMGLIYTMPYDEEDLRRYQKERIPGKDRRDVVTRQGTRVTRAEWSAPCADGTRRCFTGEAHVAECATIEEAKALFHACVAELWRTVEGGEPDPTLVGVVWPLADD